MFAKLCAKRNKKGFTLAELLIVVAIIAILVAIAIPVFSAQLTAAEKRVIEANARTASSMAVAKAMLSDPPAGGQFTYTVDTDHNMVEKTDGSGEYKITVTAAGEITDVVHP